MDYNRIYALLEKYWEGDTSLEEEDALREFFRVLPPDLPAALQEAAPLFQYFGQEAAKVWELPAMAPATPGKVVKLSPWHHWMKYAAVLLTAVGIVYALKQQDRRQQEVAQMMQQQNMNDPQKAFDETKKALQLLAKNLNKGTTGMQKLSYFNDAAALVEGKEN
ncbi:hypothetical protein ACDQ55_16760 [Chitinophaga sp. 30R24]|uniref:hypothetical protein n=1 Tax=Chitinophaga sp. 30R24 TaxID=3248838 RepID=UPI003B8F2E24